jgi:hypothetical protein
VSVRVLEGDARVMLGTLADASVQCCVTSPPYWGLRDYGTARWEGGDEGCALRGRDERTVSGGAGKQYTNAGSNRVYSGDCHCGARRVDSQIGLEQTPDAFVAALVSVFREVRRVLKDDGTLFLNLGDSYWTSGVRQTGRNDTDRETPGGRGGSFRGGVRRAIACDTSGKAPEDSLARDCLCGSLCDACRAAYRIGKSHNGIQRAPPTSPRPAGRTCGC